MAADTGAGVLCPACDAWWPQIAQPWADHLAAAHPELLARLRRASSAGAAQATAERAAARREVSAQLDYSAALIAEHPGARLAS